MAKINAGVIRKYINIGLLAIIDILVIVYIARYYIDKHEMNQWQKMRQKALGMYNKGNLFQQEKRIRKDLQKARGEIVLEFASAEMLAYVSEYAQRAGLNKLNIEKIKREGKSSEYVFKLNAVGKYNDIWKFVRQIEIGKLPLKFDDMMITNISNNLRFVTRVYGSSRKDVYGKLKIEDKTIND